MTNTTKRKLQRAALLIAIIVLVIFVAEIYKVNHINEESTLKQMQAPTSTK